MSDYKDRIKKLLPAGYAQLNENRNMTNDSIKQYINSIDKEFSNWTEEEKDRLRVALALFESSRHCEQTGEMRISLDGQTKHYSDEEAAQVVASIKESQAMQNDQPESIFVHIDGEPHEIPTDLWLLCAETQELVQKIVAGHITESEADETLDEKVAGSGYSRVKVEKTYQLITGEMYRKPGTLH